MIYETVRNEMDDLRTRWADVDDACNTLLTELAPGDPSIVLVTNLQVNQVQLAVGALNGQIAALAAPTPVPVFLATAQGALTQSDGFYLVANPGFTALLPAFVASASNAIAGSGRNLEARLELLGDALERVRGNLVDTTTNEGARSNIANISTSTSDISTYPVLTQELGTPGTSYVPGAPGGGSGAGSLGSIASRSIAEVLGRRPRVCDTKSFVAALNAAFTCEDFEGHTVCKWTGPAYLGTTDLGGSLSGAQASIYDRAKVARDNAVPLLDGLYALRSDADEQEVDAARAIVHTEFVELVSELGVEGGPRVVRLDDLFQVVLDDNYEVLPPRAGLILDPMNNDLFREVGAGALGRMGDVMGMYRTGVNTLDEERNLTNFLIVRDYIAALRTSWNNFRGAFLGQGDTFFGTQLVLLSRALSVVGESTSDVAFAMDSVFLGAAERRTVQIDFPRTVAPGPMVIDDLLSWVQRFATEEGPRIIQDGGKRGARTIVPTLTRLSGLVDATFGRIRHPGGTHPRVRQTLSELHSQLDEAARLAGTIQ